MNIKANLSRLWLIALAFANPSCNHQQAAVTRMLLPGQVLVTVPAVPETVDQSSTGERVQVRNLFETALYPGEQKTEVRKYCGLRNFTGDLLEQTLTQAGFTVQWSLRIDDWVDVALRFRRGALYGDMVSLGDDKHDCRAFLIRVQMAVDMERPAAWAQPFFRACGAFDTNAVFPYSPDVYPPRAPEQFSPCQPVERPVNFNRWLLSDGVLRETPIPK